MPGSPRIRPATLADLDELIQLAKETFPDDRSVLRSLLQPEVENWQSRKSVTLVARDELGAFLGYSRARPNVAFEEERLHGQVAVVTHVAVQIERRSEGVGSELLRRTLKTLRLLGYSIAMAQVPLELRGWYSDGGWTVHQPGELVVWIEPPGPHDEVEWTTAPRTFAPILYLDYLPPYPLIAEFRLLETELIAKWKIDGRAGGIEKHHRVLAGLAHELRADPTLKQRIPQGLVRAIGQQDSHSAAYRLLTQGERP
ncbi:GNAT family N-acetyltransferase [Leifsonia sp. P73]|uniref:GNAT family N-acetyltransferase n=1 Tax=Leifsonia sp. P73 TaxID=3423959 RepID=UPI003DA4F046